MKVMGNKTALSSGNEHGKGLFSGTNSRHALKMKPKEFIAFSACTMTLTALGIDIMLPAFGAVRSHFGLAAESTLPSRIIAFFFMGQLAQIIFGTLSDRFGRLPILRVGFPLYIAGGLAAAFAPSLEVMFAARFVAGVGASAVFMTTIAGVRDRFEGDGMARVMSLIFAIFLFTPVFAPFIGLAILSFSSWQMVFLTPPLFAVMVLLWSLRLEESLPKDKRIPLKWERFRLAIRQVINNTIFLRYTGITTVLFMGLSSYVASSEHIVGEIYGRPELFAWIFAGIGLLMSLCSFLNSHLSNRYGAKRSLRWLLYTYTAVAALLLLFTLATGDQPDMVVFFIGVAVLMAINLAVEPNSSALAMQPMGQMAGMASSVYGTAFFFIGTSLGSVISTLMVDSVFPLVLSFFVIGIITLLLALGDRRPSAPLS
jgi:DHA1 family bicyclomycin/chloramphenicol resistance-like MFS transporter